MAVGTADEIHVRDNIVVTRDKQPRKSDPGATERFVVRIRSQKQPGGIGTANAKFLERGTEKMSARPFLRPAFDAKKQTALDVIIAKLKDGVAKAQAKLGK